LSSISGPALTIERKSKFLPEMKPESDAFALGTELDKELSQKYIAGWSSW
jgi:hypothetical protein